MELGPALQNNQFFQGGVILGALGAAVAYLRTLPKIIWQFIKRRIITTVEIQGDDPLFNWFSAWFTSQAYSQRNRSLIANTYVKYREKCDGNTPIERTSTSSPPKLANIALSPAPGYHFIWYKNVLVSVTRSREKINGATSLSSFLYESYYLTFYTRNRKIVEEFFVEVRQQELDRIGTKITYNVARDGWWDGETTLTYRSLESVVLPKTIKESIVEDLNTFLQSKQRYTDLGVPYRRGYLFFGEPGSGKTSLITALAHYFQLNIFVLPLSSSGINDITLAALYRKIPTNSIIVVEDIDCIFDGREGDSKITFSGFLNAIDGIASGDGKILIMTTNHIDKLDPALVRPGRVDVRVKFGKADLYIMSEMFKRFYPTSKLCSLFLHAYEETKLTPAELQQLFLRCSDPRLLLKDKLNGETEKLCQLEEGRVQSYF